VSDGTVAPLEAVLAARGLEVPVVEAMTSRLAPGAGSIDFAGLFADLDHIGASPILSPEVFNVERQAQGDVAWAEEIAAGCRAVLAS
jgi:sugar phosphate isomerase/epimerase